MAVSSATAPALPAAERSIADKVAESLLHRRLAGDFVPRAIPYGKKIKNACR